MTTHPDGDVHKGAVESDSPNDHAGNTTLSKQLPHRAADLMIKNDAEDNDTDFPEQGRTPEHS